MGERDVNAALAAANPTQLLSPRELVDMIRTWKARAEAAEARVKELETEAADLSGANLTRTASENAELIALSACASTFNRCRCGLMAEFTLIG
jgi:hypothetical protein